MIDIDIDDYISMLEGSHVYIEGVDKILFENAKLKTEYEKECHRADELEDSYWKAEKENEKLKELLKRARKHLSEQETPYSLIKKIDEVLK